MDDNSMTDKPDNEMELLNAIDELSTEESDQDYLKKAFLIDRHMIIERENSQRILEALDKKLRDSNADREALLKQVTETFEMKMFQKRVREMLMRTLVPSIPDPHTKNYLCSELGRRDLRKALHLTH